MNESFIDDVCSLSVAFKASVVRKSRKRTATDPVAQLRHFAVTKGICAQLGWSLIVPGVLLGAGFNDRVLPCQVPLCRGRNPLSLCFLYGNAHKLKIVFILNILIFFVFSSAIRQRSLFGALA